MNWIDIVIIAVLLLFGLHGALKGFLALFVELLSFVVALLIAWALYTPVSSIIPDGGPSKKAIAFLVVFLFSEILILWPVRLLYMRIPESVRRSNVNRVLGVIPGVLEGLVIIALILSLITAIPTAGQIREAVMRSDFGSRLARGASALHGIVPEKFAVTIQPESEERLDLPFRTTNVRVDIADEQELLRLTNQERAQRGLPILTMDPELQEAARNHARDMLARGYFSHISPEGGTPPERAVAAGARFMTLGENIALYPDVAAAHQGLMNSPGHRANILNPAFHRVGIGAINAPPYGTMYAQEFAD